MGDALRVDYYISPEAYLEAERTRKHKHEYLAGVEYQVADASAGHNRIVVPQLAFAKCSHASDPRRRPT